MYEIKLNGHYLSDYGLRVLDLDTGSITPSVTTKSLNNNAASWLESASFGTRTIEISALLVAENINDFEQQKLYVAGHFATISPAELAIYTLGESTTGYEQPGQTTGDPYDITSIEYLNRVKSLLASASPFEYADVYSAEAITYSYIGRDNGKILTQVTIKYSTVKTPYLRRPTSTTSGNISSGSIATGYAGSATIPMFTYPWKLTIVTSASVTNPTITDAYGNTWSYSGTIASGTTVVISAMQTTVNGTDVTQNVSSLNTLNLSAHYSTTFTGTWSLANAYDFFI